MGVWEVQQAPLELKAKKNDRMIYIRRGYEVSADANVGKVCFVNAVS